MLSHGPSKMQADLARACRHGLEAVVHTRGHLDAPRLVNRYEIRRVCEDARAPVNVVCSREALGVQVHPEEAVALYGGGGVRDAHGTLQSRLHAEAISSMYHSGTSGGELAIDKRAFYGERCSALPQLAKQPKFHGWRTLLPC